MVIEELARAGMTGPGFMVLSEMVVPYILAWGRNLDKIGLKAQDTSELFFSAVRAAVAHRLGEERRGFAIMMTRLAQERLRLRRTVFDQTLKPLGLTRSQGGRHGRNPQDGETVVHKRAPRGSRSSGQAAAARAAVAQPLEMRMAEQILVFYGSYRSDRMGIRLADFIVAALRARGDAAELIDAKAVGLPMLDRMYKEYAPGSAPPAMQSLATKIRAADAFIFVVGEYNWGMQPGLKNLTDHFLEEWFWRPAAVASYSAGRLSGARSGAIWHGTLSEMGMVVISSTLSVGPISHTLDLSGKPIGDSGQGLEKAFPKFADDLAWWSEAARSQRARKAPPY